MRREILDEEIEQLRFRLEWLDYFGKIFMKRLEKINEWNDNERASKNWRRKS